MSDLDRTLSSFAADNLGPRSVATTHKQATKLGLCPSAWIDDVEIAAAEALNARSGAGGLRAQRLAQRWPWGAPARVDLETRVPIRQVCYRATILGS